MKPSSGFSFQTGDNNELCQARASDMMALDIFIFVYYIYFYFCEPGTLLVQPSHSHWVKILFLLDLYAPCVTGQDEEVPLPVHLHSKVLDTVKMARGKF